ncbi:MAG: hypothetical protein WCI32_06205, partial [Actinomycetota bacterium]
MVLSVFERRRIVVLTALTLIIMFTVRGFNSSESAATTTVVIATTVPPIDETEIPAPVILGGPAPLAPTGSAAIAYPAAQTDVITGTAAYSNLGYTETAVCYSIEAPIGRVVTVTNINNGRSITCTNVFSLLVPN